MERIEALEKALGEVVKAVREIAEELKEVKKEVKQSRKAKPASLKLHKTEFKVKESRYNNGSKIVIVEKGKDSIAFALNKEDWLKLREFLDGYFGIVSEGNSSNGSKPKSNGKNYSKANGKSYSKSYRKKSNSEPSVRVVKGYSKALDEEEAD
jgi:CTP-dependent riboflavin kinase